MLHFLGTPNEKTLNLGDKQAGLVDPKNPPVGFSGLTHWVFRV